MQMTPTPPPTPGTGQVPVPERGQSVGWGGSVCSPGVGGHTGSPEQRPAGSARVPAPIPQPPSGSAPARPLVSRPRHIL